MAANLVIKTIEVTSTWQKLAASRQIMNAWLRVLYTATIASFLELRVNGGSAVTFPKNVSFDLKNVDLSQIEVKGDALLRVTVVATST